MTQEYHFSENCQASAFAPGSERKLGGGGVLPCLYSNNSTEQNTRKGQEQDQIQTSINLLSPYHRKQAHTLTSNVKRLIEGAKSIGHIAFITLTFKENLKDHKEAGKRFNSFNNHFLRPNPDYGNWANVKERQDRGALHYHMIVETAHDIREGFDFDLYAEWLKTDLRRKRCPTGNNELRRMWAELRDAIQDYKFGWIVSVEPIKSSTEAISHYVGKYVSKHVENREAEDRGARMINYSQGFLRNSPKFQWKTENSSLWRKKLQIFAEYCGCSDMYQLTEKLGAGWAFKYCDQIMKIEEILEENGGQVYPEHSAPEFGRIEENASVREREDLDRLNIIKRKSPLSLLKEKAKQEVARALIVPWKSSLPETSYEEHEKNKQHALASDLEYWHKFYTEHSGTNESVPF